MDIPMPTPVVPPRPLTDYKVLSFDVYGTLIEYKGHILKIFQPLIERLPPSSPYRDTQPLSTAIPNAATIGDIAFLKLFQKEEDKIKLERPVPRFDEILTQIWSRIAQAIQVATTEEEARKFGSEATIASWPVFPKTIESLTQLSNHYKLVALSNIDAYAWSITSRSTRSPLGQIDWWKVFTAEDFKDESERADDAKLETLLDHVNKQGLDKNDVLHVAQSLGHDHAPAQRWQIASVFLTGDGPRWGKLEESKMAVEKGLVGYAWRCEDLAQFTTTVQEAFERRDI